jgi:hypothetical protein
MFILCRMPEQVLVSQCLAFECLTVGCVAQRRGSVARTIDLGR